MLKATITSPVEATSFIELDTPDVTQIMNSIADLCNDAIIVTQRCPEIIRFSIDDEIVGFVWSGYTTNQTFYKFTINWGGGADGYRTLDDCLKAFLNELFIRIGAKVQ